VFNEQNERFVWVRRNDDSFERRPVQLGVADFDFVEVIKGLQPGEIVSLLAPAVDASAGRKAAGKGGAAAMSK
jgi:hypothetical protein